MSAPSLHSPLTAPTPAGPPHPALVAQPQLVLCDECDAVHERMPLERGQVARCQRCNALLGRAHVVTPNGQLAFALAGLIFLLIGNMVPLVTLELRGIKLSVTLPHAIALTWQLGQPLVAVLTVATAILFPFLLLALRVYVLGFFAWDLLPPGFKWAMRALRIATYWSMVEVLMISAMVAIVRSSGLAGVTPGLGFFAYALLTLLLTSITAAGLHTMWKRGSALGAG